jgi:hypothetical protein
MRPGRDGEAEAARRRERRQRIAHEAARLMATQGPLDSREAARRAARLLGIDDAHALPDHAEVLAQLRDYQRLFQSETQPAALRRRRESALEAMRFLAAFAPVVYGPVLDGSADERSPVSMQVFCDDADEFARFVIEQGWAAEAFTLRLRLRRGQAQDFLAWRFPADGLVFEVVALPTQLQRQAPLDEDGRPMARAGEAALRAEMGP